VVVLIKLVTFVCRKTLVWQLDVALVGVLLVDGMKPKAFFCQVSAN